MNGPTTGQNHQSGASPTWEAAHAWPATAAQPNAVPQQPAAAHAGTSGHIRRCTYRRVMPVTQDRRALTMALAEVNGSSKRSRSLHPFASEPPMRPHNARFGLPPSKYFQPNSLKSFTDRAICGKNSFNRCPYPSFPFPTISLIRAPALDNQTVPLSDPSRNPLLERLREV
jgi:hypothetical protein